jgi:hypothetical protein
MRTLRYSAMLIIFSSHALCQSLILASGEFGYFPYHSDNSLPITETDNFSFYYGGTIGFETAVTPNYNIHVEVGYFQANIDKLFEYSGIFLSNPNSITTQSATLIQRSFPVDLSISPNSSSILKYALGISFVYTNREMQVPYKYPDDPFVDKFNSYGIGANLIIQSMFPLFGSDRFNIVCSSKFRYIYSILYEGKGRDLSGYELDYYQINISLGFAWRIQ